MPRYQGECTTVRCARFTREGERTVPDVSLEYQNGGTDQDHPMANSCRVIRIPSPQNRTTDARDARRVRGSGAPRRLLTAARPGHLAHLARRCERHPLENGLLVGDVGDGGHRAVGARRRR